MLLFHFALNLIPENVNVIINHMMTCKMRDVLNLGLFHATHKIVLCNAFSFKMCQL